MKAGIIIPGLIILVVGVLVGYLIIRKPEIPNGPSPEGDLLFTPNPKVPDKLEIQGAQTIDSNLAIGSDSALQIK